MKKLVRAILCALLALSCATGALAVTLVNKDGVKYRLIVRSSGGTTETSIESSTTTGICTECEIEVVGVGKISAKGDETVVIKDGKLSKQ